MVRQIVRDWDDFVTAVDTLTREHEEQRAILERLTAENHALREAHARLQQEHEMTLRVLAGLRAEHDTLREELETTARELAEARGRHEALLQDRQFAAEELGVLLKSLKV